MATVGELGGVRAQGLVHCGSWLGHLAVRQERKTAFCQEEWERHRGPGKGSTVSMGASSLPRPS